MTAKLGHFEIIENKDKPVFSHAKDTYIAGYVCDPSGSDIRYIMFADTELNDKCVVSVDVPMELGRMYRMSHNGKNSYLISCYINDKQVTRRHRGTVCPDI